MDNKDIIQKEKEEKEKVEKLMNQLHDEQMKLHPEIYEKTKE